MSVNVLGTPQDAPAAGGFVQQALTLLTRRSGRAQRAAQAIVVGAAAWEIGNKIVHRVRGELQYQVAVPSEDDTYVLVHAWLIDNLPPQKRRALTIRSPRSRGGQDSAQPTISPADPTYRARAAAPGLRMMYDGSKSQSVSIDGYRVRVDVERESYNNPFIGARLNDDDSRSFWRDRERIVFRCTGTQSRDAVMRLLQRISESLIEVQPPSRFYMATRWSEWVRKRDLPRRSLDTIVLRAGQRETIEADLADFLGSEEKYGRIGLPWHRGYVLHGPPGTGKTSLAKSLAERFELDVHYIPLSDLTGDTNLLQMLSNVDPRSMLVLEDIDVVHASKARDDKDSKDRLSLSGLLNALDGFTTPHGLVTVMTTNDMKVLDDALLRPGRADRREYLGYVDDDQLARLVQLVCRGEWDAATVPMPVLPDSSTPKPAKITHAEVIEAAKPHLDEPFMAALAIRARVHELIDVPIEAR